MNNPSFVNTIITTIIVWYNMFMLKEISERVNILLGKMTLEEKVGQMTQVTLDVVLNGRPYNPKKPFAFNESHTINIVQINHYWGKSEEDLKEKIERGRAPVDKKREMPINYHSKHNDKIDESLKNKYSHLVKKKMIELKLK